MILKRPRLGWKRRAASVSKGGKGVSVGEIKGGVIRRVEYFQTLLRRNKTEKPAPRGRSSLCVEPPPSLPTLSLPKDGSNSQQGQKDPRRLRAFASLHRAFVRRCPGPLSDGGSSTTERTALETACRCAVYRVGRGYILAPA